MDCLQYRCETALSFSIYLYLIFFLSLVQENVLNTHTISPGLLFVSTLSKQFTISFIQGVLRIVYVHQ